MNNITNYSQLQNEILKRSYVALDKITDIIFKELYNYIEEEIYIKQTLKISPSIRDIGYEQTGEFLEALKRSAIINTGKSLKAVIYFDYNTMTPQRQSRFFNAHMSLNGDSSYNGSSISSLMPNWLDTGINTPYYSHTGIQFKSFIEDFVKQNYFRMMKIELNNMGIKIV